jgi:hypothetical protein
MSPTTRSATRAAALTAFTKLAISPSASDFLNSKKRKRDVGDEGHVSDTESFKKGAVDNPVRESHSSDNEIPELLTDSSHSSPPTPPEYSPTDMPDLVGPSPTFVPVAPIPAPFINVPGNEIYGDLNKLNQEINGLSSDDPDMDINHQRAIDPRLTQFNPDGTINAHSRYADTMYEFVLGDRTFTRNCACRQRDSHVHAYIQGRVDEHNDILEDNRRNRFVAIRDYDFHHMITQLKGTLDAEDTQLLSADSDLDEE